MNDNWGKISSKKWIIIVVSFSVALVGYVFAFRYLSENETERVSFAIRSAVEDERDIILLNSFDIKFLSSSASIMSGEMLRRQVGEVVGNTDEMKLLRVALANKGLVDVRGYYDPYKRRYNLFVTRSKDSQRQIGDEIFLLLEKRVNVLFQDRANIEIDTKLAKLRAQEKRLERENVILDELARFNSNQRERLDIKKNILLIRSEIKELLEFKDRTLSIPIFDKVEYVGGVIDYYRKSFIFFLLCFFASSVICIIYVCIPMSELRLKPSNIKS
ncbi:hypothetical protein AB1A81_07690 [Bdellovibrio bacteriovorus]|uniref:Uncharacterized protein n=1 Tax=Bdellovibrio bacteriovorus (strain ATCC 15356 / DSM 50701 / NCIMB 9529 / HD100) TaxID=264462 RepID=Q6MME7_BDEBA|nr:hypothetical protein [Bdellovibrio bacteriovorus]CAE79557.1 hypothetical protein predicted by Glimmer/Critica [Bdellovibrio bacteriovorus HD100]